MQADSGLAADLHAYGPRFQARPCGTDGCTGSQDSPPAGEESCEQHRPAGGGGRTAPRGTVIGTPSLWPSKLAGGGPIWPPPRGPLGSIPKTHHAHSRSANPPNAHKLVSPKCPSLVPAPSRAWALPPKSINIGGSIPFVDQHRYERSYRLYAYAYEYKLHVLAGGLPTRAVGSVPKLSAKSVASRSAKTSAE